MQLRLSLLQEHKIVKLDIITQSEKFDQTYCITIPEHEMLWY